ncbi:hypothetical protein GTQ34_02650 [Muricauda sp. JGD-17]|uniref:Uncharacterized protein n=1 Tax=Flagellimonas ochracea TaxID=2696472 RepID=A0A964WW98_9FLAO|nr:hypothetical protein [Allomuricauda ochracea]NAY90806.1 hypothetical protein [Allomuricauda ochracea]
MKSRTRILLAVLATLVGGFSLVLYNTLSRDIIFSGLNFCSSSDIELIMAGLSTFASATIAGFITSLIVVRDNNWPHFLISLFIVAKMSFIIIHLQSSGPVWFEAALQLSLLGGLWFGRYSASKFPLAPV